MHIHIHLHIYICNTHIYIYLFIYIYLHTYTYIHICAHTYTDIHRQQQAYTYINGGGPLHRPSHGLPWLGIGKAMVTWGSLILRTTQMPTALYPVKKCHPNGKQQLAQVAKHSKELEGLTAKMETEENKVWPVGRCVHGCDNGKEAENGLFRVSVFAVYLVEELHSCSMSLSLEQQSSLAQR